MPCGAGRAGARSKGKWGQTGGWLWPDTLRTNEKKHLRPGKNTGAMPVILLNSSFYFFSNSLTAAFKVRSKPVFRSCGAFVITTSGQIPLGS